MAQGIDFMEDSFSMDQGWVNGFRMIQDHYIYCVNFISIIGGSWGKESACHAPEFNPWVWKIPWRRKWHPLQYSCLGNPMVREAWWAAWGGKV